MPTPKKAKVGRPSKREGLDLNRVKTLASAGLTMAQLAVVLEVNADSLYQWQKESSEFSEILKGGKAMADERVERSLFERATGYTHASEEIHFDRDGKVTRAPILKHYPPDPASMIFWLKNRQGDKWREKVEQEHRFPEPLILKSADGSVLAHLGSA